MRIFVSAVALLTFAAALDGSTASASGSDDGVGAIDARFREVVRPFLAEHCLSCHAAEEPEGDLDLSAFNDPASAAKDLAHWESVLDRLRAGTMPPSKVKKRPTPEARNEVIAWIEAVRKAEAARNAGDPGAVPARRLSNAEYDYTIRDLTGVDLRPTREFPVDPANEAGFDNTGESLSMSPALAKKYLEAARSVADHLVLKSSGLAFAEHAMLADTDRDKYSVRRIIDFYKRQKTDLADYFFAAWKYRNRAALGRPDAPVDAFAADARISGNYLRMIISLLEDPAAATGPIAAVQSLWKELPGVSKEPEAWSGCVMLRDFVVELRGRLTPEVKNPKAPGIQDGSQTMVLWKNRELVANRRKYRGGASRIRPESLKSGTPAARTLAAPGNVGEIEGEYDRFCSVFPDTFYVSERGRAYVDPNEEKANAGRLLSAGFHSMTGYFRDDAPLSELILDDDSRRELDRLWDDFNAITGAPTRQFSSFIWFERAESGTISGPEFDFARSEDKAAASAENIARLAAVYRERTQKRGAKDEALKAIDDYFRIISQEIRRVEASKAAAEPGHIEDLIAVAEKAFRGPLSDSDRAGIAAFYRTLRDSDGLSHEDAIRDSVVAILMSPRFCYRVDLPSSGPGIQALTDYDLASRLSYFLWSSMPDARLLALAASGELHRPEVLKAETRRMLQDPKSRGLAAEFAGNWLDFRRFEEHNSVDRNRFPTFDDTLRRSMFEEPIRFFENLVARDGSILDFLDARHTFVDAPLAKHYGIPNPSFGPDGWARIDDARPYQRGGLLTMAAFLTKNSPGLRTSPVKRGYWVVRRLLGEKIPAPPANVPDLPEDESKLGETTLRAALARHRADASCAGCHERFDAIGLAYEGFGPVGEARSLDLGGRPVDAKATFPGGSEGEGIEGLRAYLDANRREEFVENLCRKLLSYGLGRTLQASDDSAVEAMKSRLASEGNRFGAMVEEIVVSPQFRNRRGGDLSGAK